ncbi:elongation factor 4 [Candidatus Roizmanbacteria bacterium]|nr:elongation factor 4 [Candidatus Roizmanbacteria bacterium]
MDVSRIRNFAIIAHVDHGKSTLADRFLELTGVVKAGGHEEQFLDRNPISRERGITIKLAPVTMKYKLTNSKINELTNLLTREPVNPIISQEYTLNLIDTPGHVDFSYEVDRTLACVEGVILLVDCTQGVQAQTIANAYKAIEKNLVIIPVINKVDMANAQVEKTKKQLMGFLGIDESEIFEISAKTGLNVEKLLKTVVEKIPAPNKIATSPGFAEVPRNDKLRALIFDSYYDSHKGVIAFIRVINGSINKGKEIKMVHTGESFKVLETGIFKPDLSPTDTLSYGEIGYVATNLKDIHKVEIGDTMGEARIETEPLPGYKKVKPMVYASVFPTDTQDYLNLKKALEKLYLNDSALQFSSIFSKALGAGFRVGFLGLLHADVVRERLEREYELSIVLTPPQVEYKIENGEFYEPYAKILILTPEEYMGAIMKLCDDYRATFITMDNRNQVSLTYEIPMSEMISDFFDNLKSVTSGYASLDWELSRYQHVDADKLELLLNMEPIEEFSEVVVKERAMKRGAELTKKLHGVIPRQQFEIRIQARYKGKILASERIAPFRKDVLMHKGKLVGGGDFSRKRKLLEQQKEGKKLMKSVGTVEIPKEAFMKMFKKN